MRQILEIRIHPRYDQMTIDHDLALIKLDTKVQLNERVRTACLPGGETHFPIGTTCSISGWGKLSEEGDGPVVSDFKLLANQLISLKFDSSYLHHKCL